MSACNQCEQIVAYGVSFFAGGVMFFLWYRLNQDDRRRVWRLYGWFSALMTLGSCIGMVTWLAKMMHLASNLRASDVIQQSAQASQLRLEGKADLLLAESAKWNAVFSVTYATEFLFLTGAKLLILERMSVFATHAPDRSRRLKLAGNLLMIAVVVGNVVGLIANAVAAHFFRKSSELSVNAYNFFSANITDLGKREVAFSRGMNDDAVTAAAVSQHCHTPFVS